MVLAGILYMPEWMKIEPGSISYSRVTCRLEKSLCHELLIGV